MGEECGGLNYIGDNENLDLNLELNLEHKLDRNRVLDSKQKLEIHLELKKMWSKPFTKH